MGSEMSRHFLGLLVVVLREVADLSHDEQTDALEKLAALFEGAQGPYDAECRLREFAGTLGRTLEGRWRHALKGPDRP